MPPARLGSEISTSSSSTPTHLPPGFASLQKPFFIHHDRVENHQHRMHPYLMRSRRQRFEAGLTIRTAASSEMAFDDGGYMRTRRADVSALGSTVSQHLELSAMLGQQPGQQQDIGYDVYGRSHYQQPDHAPTSSPTAMLQPVENQRTTNAVTDNHDISATTFTTMPSPHEYRFHDATPTEMIWPAPSRTASYHIHPVTSTSPSSSPASSPCSSQGDHTAHPPVQNQPQPSHHPQRPPTPLYQFTASLVYSQMDGTEGPDGKTKLRTTKHYVCPVCAKQFTRMYTLKSHLKSHNPAEETAGAAGGSKNNRSSQQEKAFMCKTCGARFSRSHDLLRHEKIHSKEKPFVCEACGRRFSRRDALRRHEKVDPTGRRYCPYPPAVTIAVNNTPSIASATSSTTSPGCESTASMGDCDPRTQGEAPSTKHEASIVGDASGRVSEPRGTRGTSSAQVEDMVTSPGNGCDGIGSDIPLSVETTKNDAEPKNNDMDETAGCSPVSSISTRTNSSVGWGLNGGGPHADVTDG
ncbi:hypothetical protein HK102_006834 [Quaeritorhiza haematococci]|nr:hypothetical protein HK102_006834 [Quaeritorhiza haematococci]